MPEIYTVQANDTLSKIAKKYNFRDGGDAIWNANPETQQKTGGNREVLREGWELKIPNKTTKDAGKPTDQKGTQQVTIVKKNLSFVLRDSQGTPVDGTWTYRFVQGNSKPQAGTTNTAHILIKDIDEDTPQASLEVSQEDAYKAWNAPIEKIELTIGGLDPISDGTEGVVAVQKMLTNLGFYGGEADGTISSETRAAVCAFKRMYTMFEVNGQMTATFCRKLQQQVISLPLGDPGDPDADYAAKPDFAAPLMEFTKAEAKDDSPAFQEADAKPEAPQPFQKYEEPTDNDVNGEGKDLSDPNKRSVGKLRFFPVKAYVAPCTDQQELVNTIQMPARKFVFIDTGNFYSNHTTFGVIWGPHVYLCNYKGGVEAAAADETDEAGPPPGSQPPRLDQLFFKALGSCYEVQKRAVAYWASDTELDWTNLYLIVPDMHLMTGEHAGIWHKKAYGIPFVNGYDFEVERKFLAFAKTLQTRVQHAFQQLQSLVKVVQIGDSYDLWVGCSPRLFTENGSRQMQLMPTGQLENAQKCAVRIGEWVRAIQADGPDKGDDDGDPLHPKISNPAVLGLTALEETFGSIAYIYGNHDNYLILPEVCEAAGLSTPRVRWAEYKGLFIEHAHRLEAKFSDPKAGADVAKAGGIMEDAGTAVAVAGAATAFIGAKTGSKTLETVGIIAAGVGVAALGAGALMEEGVHIVTARNYDGDPSGYDATNALFTALDLTPKGIDIPVLGPLLGLPIKGEQSLKETADKQAKNHDQPQYISEFARVWLGRQNSATADASAGSEAQTPSIKSPPHICVIGHTHIPELLEIAVEPWRKALPSATT